MNELHADCHKAELMDNSTVQFSFIFQEREVLTHYREDLLKKNINQHLSFFKEHFRIIKSLATQR